jgi:hypothetical protein
VTDRAAHFVQSLERGLGVIRAFDAEHPELTLSDVARSTGLTRAASRRFLLTLADLGYVRTDGRWFSLSPRVLELGYAYLSSLSLPEVAEPHLQQHVGEADGGQLFAGGRLDHRTGTAGGLAPPGGEDLTVPHTGVQQGHLAPPCGQLPLRLCSDRERMFCT